MTMTRYAEEIDRILDKMFSVKKFVLPANRRSVEQYLDTVWSPVTELTAGFRRIKKGDVMEKRFEAYVDAEESRLQNALQDINYQIDAVDILQLVTGSGRIDKVRSPTRRPRCLHNLLYRDKSLFPLIYLLLKRDYDILRLSGSVILHKDELRDSASSFQWIFWAVSDRCVKLESMWNMITNTEYELT